MSVLPMMVTNEWSPCPYLNPWAFDLIFFPHPVEDREWESSWVGIWQPAMVNLPPVTVTKTRQWERTQRSTSIARCSLLQLQLSVSREHEHLCSTTACLTALSLLPLPLLLEIQSKPKLWGVGAAHFQFSFSMLSPYGVHSNQTDYYQQTISS